MKLARTARIAGRVAPWAILAALRAVAEPSPAVPPAPADPSPPNVVFILADDLGWGDLSCYGAPDLHTPHLDRLARRGVLFSDFYAPSSNCSASRGGYATGRNPHRTGLIGVLRPRHDVGLPLREVTTAEALGYEGYATALLGKWHLGGTSQYLPARQGFEQFFGVLHSHDFDRIPLYWNDVVVEERPGFEAMLLPDLTAAATEWIHTHRDEPFFLQIAHIAPHEPLRLDGAYPRGTSERGLLGDVVRALDASVGTILGALAEAGLEERTIVVFASDNGPPWIGDRARPKSTGGLRGGKNTVYEGGVRVPGIVAWPGTVEGGRVVGQVASGLDLHPTFLASAGAHLAEERVLDGVNLLPLLVHGEPLAPRTLCIDSERGLSAVRHGRWKYQHRPHRRLGEDRGGALFDLEADPFETTDVAGANPDVLRRMRAIARERLREVEGDLPRTDEP